MLHLMEFVYVSSFGLLVCLVILVTLNIKVNRKVPGVPQSQAAANP